MSTASTKVKLPELFSYSVFTGA